MWFLVLSSDSRPDTDLSSVLVLRLHDKPCLSGSVEQIPVRKPSQGEKKRASWKTHTHTKLSRYDIVLRWPRSPGVGFGGEFAEGHLPYALRVRPQTKACHCKQDRQPDAPLSKGGRGGWKRGVEVVCGGCVCVCVFMAETRSKLRLVNEEVVAVATLW